MSTVITNAYRLPGTTSVPALARALSTNTAHARREAVLADIATVVRVLVDDATEPVRAALDILAYPLTVKQFRKRPGVRAIEPARGDGTDVRTPLRIAAEVVRAVDDYLQGVNCRRQQLDSTASVAFLSDPESSEHIYATVYCDRAEIGLVVGTTLVEFEGEQYPYWNNTDRPDGMTKADWAARAAIWDRVIGDEPPAASCVTWQTQPLHSSLISRIFGPVERATIAALAGCDVSRLDVPLYADGGSLR